MSLLAKPANAEPATSVSQKPKPHTGSFRGPQPLPAFARVATGAFSHTAMPPPGQVVHSIQPKLTVNQPGDSYEQEADQVADRVMRMSVPEKVESTVHPSPGLSTLQRKCACGGTCRNCLHGPEEQLQRKPAVPDRLDHASAPQIVHEALRAPGSPLDAATRSFMEPRFGRNLSAVRVHTGSQAAESAGAVNALAYTSGHNIVFGSGSFAPATPGGRRLLAHELAHVMQQSGESHRGAETSMLQRQPDATPDAAEPTFDPEAARQAQLDDIEETLPALDGKAAAAWLRFKLLVNSARADWADEAAFDGFIKKSWASVVADTSEEDLIALLGDPDLTDPEAFPDTWADRLQAMLSPPQPEYLVQRDVDSAYLEMQGAETRLAGQVFAHGLPVSFLGSLTLETFGLIATFMDYRWLASPSGVVDAGWTPLAELPARAEAYTAAIKEMARIRFWIKDAQELVQEVRDSIFTVDPDAYQRYAANPVQADSSLSLFTALTASFLTQGKVGPDLNLPAIDAANAPLFITANAGVAALAGYNRRNLVAVMANQFLEQADSSIAGEEASDRLIRAQDWSLEHGFYGATISQQWDQFKDHIVGTIAGGVATHVGLKAIGLLLPGVDFFVLLIMVGQQIKEAKDNVEALQAANQEARDASSVAELQRAAAKLAVATAAAAGQIASAVAAHVASMVGKAVWKKAANYINKKNATATRLIGEGDHESVVTPEGVGACSPDPCPNIGVEFAAELEGNTDLQARNEAVQSLRETNPDLAAERGAALIRDLRTIRSQRLAEAQRPAAAAAPNDPASPQPDDPVTPISSADGRTPVSIPYTPAKSVPRWWKWTVALSQAVRGEGLRVRMDEIVDMPFGGTSTNSAGYLRDSSYFFKTLYRMHEAFFSPENQRRIFAEDYGEDYRAPKVDEQWIQFHPEHAWAFEDTLHHHHIGGGGRAIALPGMLHNMYGWNKAWHLTTP